MMPVVMSQSPWASRRASASVALGVALAAVLATWPTGAAAGYGWKRESFESRLSPAVAAITSTPSGVAYALTPRGEVFRYDGRRWDCRGVFPGGDGVQYHAIRALGETGLIAVGDENHLGYFDGKAGHPLVLVDTGAHAPYDRYPLTALWAFSPTEILVGGRSRLGRFDGTTWQSMEIPPGYLMIRSLWGASPTDVWAAANAHLMHFDGSAWTLRSDTFACEPTALWGSSASDVFLVGTEGCIYHYDGASWARMESGTNATLLSVWGSAPDDVYAVGRGGTALHYDGAAWSRVDVGTGVDLVAVHARGRNDVFIATQADGILHYRNWPSSIAVRLPETGQSGSWEANDDGDLQAGDPLAWISVPALPFTRPGNGTVIDTVTNLVWLKNADLAGRAMTWQDALTFVQRVNAGAVPGGLGYSDWRLPNVNELERLLYEDVGCLAWWLSTAGGIDNLQPSYWSSTTVEYGRQWNRAWVVTFGDAQSDHCVADSLGSDTKDALHSVWLVRGGTSGRNRVWRTGAAQCYAPQEEWDPNNCAYEYCRAPCAGTGQDGDVRAGVAWPSLRFLDNNNGTVTDLLTGLTWLQHVQCLGTRAWSDALLTVTAFNERPADFACREYSATHQDWRLPNRIELASLLDYSRSYPALPRDMCYSFPDIQALSAFWTSTTPNSTYGWAARAVDLRTGAVSVYWKDFTLGVWAVRGPSPFAVVQPEIQVSQPGSGAQPGIASQPGSGADLVVSK